MSPARAETGSTRPIYGPPSTVTFTSHLQPIIIVKPDAELVDSLLLEQSFRTSRLLQRFTLHIGRL